MSVYKPAKSRHWQYDFQFKGRRYHGSTGCTSKRDAERFEAEQRRIAALGRDTKPTITLDLATGEWHQKKGRFLANTNTEFSALVRLAEGLGKNVLLSDLTVGMIDDYVARRRASVKNATVNRELGLLRRVIRWCADRGYEVPSIRWGAVMLPEPKERVRELSEEEERRLFEHLPASLHALVEFALLSGQRRAEIVNLRWQDVDLAGARATFWVKGDKPHVVPLTPRMVAILSIQPRVIGCDHVFTYECERAAPPKMVNGKPLPRRYAGRRYPFSPQGWRRKWKKALKDAGITDYTFHDNRHTKATRTLRASRNLKAVQKLLGHADIRTTSRYAHALEDDVRQAMLEAETKPTLRPVPEQAAEAKSPGIVPKRRSASKKK